MTWAENILLAMARIELPSQNNMGFIFYIRRPLSWKLDERISCIYISIEHLTIDVKYIQYGLWNNPKLNNYMNLLTAWKLFENVIYDTICKFYGRLSRKEIRLLDDQQWSTTPLTKTFYKKIDNVNNMFEKNLLILRIISRECNCFMLVVYLSRQSCSSNFDLCSQNGLSW